jgi:hypothetical protein
MNELSKLQPERAKINRKPSMTGKPLRRTVTTVSPPLYYSSIAKLDFDYTTEPLAPSIEDPSDIEKGDLTPGRLTAAHFSAEHPMSH